MKPMLIEGMTMYRLLAALTLLISVSAIAATPFSQQPKVRQFINEVSKEAKLNKQELIKIMDQVEIQPKIIESMERPYEKKKWDEYQRLFLTQKRLNHGIEYWQTHQDELKKAEKHYGVSSHIVVAILGIETLYGQNQGDYRVIDALSTLAFNYPKRAPFFRKELKEYLILCKEQGVSPLKYKGSYAGAIGMPQFMPSSYRHYAASFTSKREKDLVSDHDTVIASVANYFKVHGWQPQQGIAQIANISKPLPKWIKTNQKKPTYTYQQLVNAGIVPKTAAFNAPKKVGIIELETEKGKEYWLAYPNFYVITRYNSSPQYALAAYLLSQQLQQKWHVSNYKHQFSWA
jgi:membrane-bound lytic murein transglycosylase B